MRGRDGPSASFSLRKTTEPLPPLAIAKLVAKLALLNGRSLIQVQFNDRTSKIAPRLDCCLVATIRGNAIENSIPDSCSAAEVGKLIKRLLVQGTIMKCNIISCFAVSALLAALPLSGALAADMPLKAPPAPPPPAYTWTGYYVGVNVGYGIGDDPTTMATVSGAGFGGGGVLPVGTPLYGQPRAFSIDPRGVTGGGQIGYNLQMAPEWVAGLEADIQGSGMKNQQNCLLACGAGIIASPVNPILAFFPVTFSNISEQHQIDWFGTVRGRFGYAAGPVLLYGTGGLAYGEVNRSGNVTGMSTFFCAPVDLFSGSYNVSSIKTGWTVGAGVEGKLAGNWSVKAEYLYIDLGNTTDSFNTIFSPGSVISTPGTVAATRTDTASYRENIFRIGLNYEFSGPGTGR
jgi:outer membrane immunogenic protein